MKILITTTGLLLFNFGLASGVNGNPVTNPGNDAVTAGAASQSPQSAKQIKWQVVAAGGARGTSTNYVLSGTAGQTAVGQGSSTGHKILQGYWQRFVTGPSYTCGDANGSATVNISDAVYLIAFIFSSGPAPSPLLAGDANCSQTVNISDAVYLIAYIFSGGPAPCAGCK